MLTSKHFIRFINHTGRISLISLIGLIPTFTSAAGIQVSPSSLEFDDASQSQTLTIVNPTADVQIFEVSADEFKDAIIIEPKSFTLESGGQKKVSITIDNAARKDGILTTNLSVLGRPLLEERFTVNTGVKIPISIESNGNQTSESFDYKWLFVGILLVLITGMLIKKQKTPL